MDREHRTYVLDRRQQGLGQPGNIMPMHKVQVDGGSHYKRRYMTLPRMITHWHQANEVAAGTRPAGQVLEIGPGSGHTTWLLRQWGFPVTTLDFDAQVKPDVVGDVTHLPLEDKCVDCVLAA